ncbi:MAG: tetratricopeptide repeat protein, partial [Candidatus Acidoferrales bacterium]
MEYNRNLDPSPARLQRAEELARRALALDPQFAGGHIALGQVYANRYDYAHAAEKFREAIRLDPQDPLAWDLLSWALAYKQPPEAQEAEKAAREAIRLQPGYAGAYYHLGRALLLQGRYQEAIAAFEHVLELSSEFDAANLGLAQVYLAQGNYDRALAELEKVRGSRESPVVLVRFCSVYAMQGKRKKRWLNWKRLWRTAIATSPTWTPVPILIRCGRTRASSSSSAATATSLDDVGVAPVVAVAVPMPVAVSLP